MLSNCHLPALRINLVRDWPKCVSIWEVELFLEFFSCEDQMSKKQLIQIWPVSNLFMALLLSILQHSILSSDFTVLCHCTVSRTTRTKHLFRKWLSSSLWGLAQFSEKVQICIFKQKMAHLPFLWIYIDPECEQNVACVEILSVLQSFKVVIA